MSNSKATLSQTVNSNSFNTPSACCGVVYFLYFLPVIVLALLLYNWKPFEITKNGKHFFGKFDFSLKNPFLIKAAIASFVILFALIVLHPGSAPAPDGRLRVDFLDVGQGDAALITFPDGETMLVDGGGKMNFGAQIIKRNDEGGEEKEIFEPDSQSVGEAVVSEFLWEKGYDSIDYILATHADADHIQGLRDAAKNFRVRGALFGATPLKNAEFAATYEILQKREVPVVKIGRGDVLTFGDVKIEVLAPEKSDAPDAPSGNNQSIVLRLNYGARKILLTGDIEKETEMQLLNAPERLRTDVVKVAHHGSRTSSIQEFVGATGAKLAVISVGQTSQFGHPHGEVVERWRSSGARVITTGERGTVSVSTDGKDLQMKTFQR